MLASMMNEIAEGSGSLVFLKILYKWEGSVYSLVWMDMLAYILLYYILNLGYRFALTPTQKTSFENAVIFCKSSSSGIPIGFILGFFVSKVILRWFNTYMLIPWTNGIAFSVMSAINSADCDISRQIRLSIMRHVNLAWILTMRGLSDRIASRFICKTSASASNLKIDEGRHSYSKATHKMVDCTVPTTPGFILNPTEYFKLAYSPDVYGGQDEWSIREILNSINADPKVKETFGKIITDAEVEAFEFTAKQYFLRTRKKYIPENWVPLTWAVRLVQKAGLHGNIPDPKIMQSVLKEIGKFRSQLQHINLYSSLTMPLVYTQVCVIALYSYFIIKLMASQFIENNVIAGKSNLDMYVPILDFLNFIFLLGWLRVALCVMSPFGDDSEDFETSQMLDYNLDVSYRLVLLEEASFPESLKIATFATRTMAGAEDDKLDTYLTNVKCEEDQAKSNENINDIENLELSRSYCRCPAMCFNNHLQQDNSENT